MKQNNEKNHIAAFISKMKQENLDEIIIDAFCQYYNQALKGETDLVYNRDIDPVDASESSSMQKWVLTYIMRTYIAILATIIIILLLQGFKPFDFNIESKFLLLLSAILSGVFTILTIIIRKLFK